MTDYTLGQRVTMLGTIAKHRVESKIRYLPEPPPKAATGIIVGKRTLQEGEANGGTWDEPAYFTREFDRPTITAYLVAYSLHRKPVLCLPEQLEQEAALGVEL